MTELMRLSQEWFQRGEHDLRTARIALEGGAPSDTIGMLLHQACEKYLKGYLLYQGWELRKTHNLVFLVGEAAKYDKDFSRFVDLAGKLSKQYLEERYPPGPSIEYSLEETRDLLIQSELLIAKITRDVSPR